MARTSLGLSKCVRDTGSSSPWGLIMAPGQEANSDNLQKPFLDFLHIFIYPDKAILTSTHNIQFHDKINIYFLELPNEFRWDSKQFELAMVNGSLVFELLRFDWMYMYLTLNVSSNFDSLTFTVHCSFSNSFFFFFFSCFTGTRTWNNGCVKIQRHKIQFENLRWTDHFGGEYKQMCASSSL